MLIGRLNIAVSTCSCWPADVQRSIYTYERSIIIISRFLVGVSLSLPHLINTTAALFVYLFIYMYIKWQPHPKYKANSAQTSHITIWERNFNRSLEAAWGRVAWWRWERSWLRTTKPKHSTSSIRGLRVSHLLFIGLAIGWDFDIDYQVAKTDWLLIKISGCN